MKIPMYHIDAFTDAIFSGNPAAVCSLAKWPDNNLLHSIAAENYLPGNCPGEEVNWFAMTLANP